MAEKKKNVEATVRDIHRARRKYNAEEKVRIILEGLRGESTIAELCRKEGIHTNRYYKCSKEFLEAGKQCLIGDTQRQAGSQEVVEMRSELEQLKLVAPELMLKNRVLTPALPLVSSGMIWRAVPGKKACWARQLSGSNDTCTCM